MACPNFTTNSFDNFKVRVTDLDECLVGLAPSWLGLPKLDFPDGSGPYKVLYMTAQVRVDDLGEDKSVLNPEDFDRFANWLQRVASTGWFSGRIAPCVSIPLFRKRPHERALLCAYFVSHKTREQLNTIFGRETFVEEGGMGPPMWDEKLPDGKRIAVDSSDEDGMQKALDQVSELPSDDG